MIRFSSILFFSFILLTSCSHNRFLKTMGLFLGQEIAIPSGLDAIKMGKDCFMTNCPQTPIKMIVWFDSLSCTSCASSTMYEWNNIVIDADSMSQWFSIVFLFSPRKKDSYVVNAILKGSKCEYPIFMDAKGNFIKQNPHLPQNQQLHTFLLDKNNKVVLVGSPLHNPPLWELYKSTIQKMIENDGIFPEQ